MRPTFHTARPIGHANKRALKTKVNIIDTTRNTAFCSLLSKYHLQFSFLTFFQEKFKKRGFCSLNVVLKPKINASQRIIFIIQTHPSKGFHKNMLKAWYLY